MVTDSTGTIGLDFVIFEVKPFAVRYRALSEPGIALRTFRKFKPKLLLFTR